MKLSCLLFVISVSINGCVGGNDGEESKPKKLRVEPNNFFVALVHRAKEVSTSKKEVTRKLNPFSVTDLESRREYERLIEIHKKAMDKQRTYRTRQGGGPVPPDAPCVTTLGLMVESNFVQFCASALVQVENGLYIIITSAICNHITGQAKLQDNTVAPDSDGNGGIYHHPYSSGLDPNIAVIRVSGPVPPSLVVLQLPSDDDRTVKGTVAWRVMYYEDRHGQDELAEAYYTVPGEIDDSPDSNRNLFRVKMNTKMMPSSDLGGSVFYVRDAQGRLVLKGIRTLLAGDYFTGIAPFADWIREKAREVRLAN